MLLISLCILAAALMLGVAAPAQAGTIQGTVWSGFGVYLPGANVTAYHFDGGSWVIIATTTTNGSGNYTLTVPDATGYHVGFDMPTFVDQWWENKASQTAATPIAVTSAGVTGINATLVPTSDMVITVDAVTGTEPMDGTLTIGWHTDMTLDPLTDPGSFWFWVRSAGATDWFMQDQVFVSSFALPGRDFEADIANLAVPDAAGYQIVVAYVPNQNLTFNPANVDSWGTSTGSFAVRAGLTVNTPVPATYTETDDMQVVWNTTADISSGQFGIWVRSSSLTNWYRVAVRQWNDPLTRKAAHGQGFTNWHYTLVGLNNATPAIPVGTGYQVIVAWQPNESGTWVPGPASTIVHDGPMCWATSPGSISVTAGDALKITAVTSPSTGVYAMDDDMTISWTTNIGIPAGTEFGIWARSTNLTSWYRLYAAPGPWSEVLGRSSFTHDITLAGVYAPINWIPAGTYQVVVACGPTGSAAANDWDSFGTSVGSFTVVAR